MTKRIFVVGDTEAVRNVLEGYLRGKSFQLEYFADGGEALKQAVSNRPDLIILDVETPSLNGVDTVDFIQVARLLYGVSFLLVGNDLSHRVVRKAQQCGIFDLVAKPVEPLPFQRQLDQALERVSGASRPAASPPAPWAAFL